MLRATDRPQHSGLRKRARGGDVRELRRDVGFENALSIDDFDGPTCTGNCFLLTFDDGYADNVTELLPILERMNLAMSLSLLKFVGQASLVDDAMLPS